MFTEARIISNERAPFDPDQYNPLENSSDSKKQKVDQEAIEMTGDSLICCRIYYGYNYPVLD